MLYDNVLLAVGGTPLIKLQRIPGEYGNDMADIYVKFEAMNVGGSIKTRTAYNMLKTAMDNGLIRENTVVTEPTSGNQGIGLALCGAVMGIKVRIIMPDSVSEERRKILSQYGAELVLIHDEGDIGKCIDECIRTALDMAEKDPDVYVPQQFENKANVEAQYEGTAREILSDIGRPVDGFCAGIGTGGTITGIGKALKNANPDTVIWAVEPENAAILSGREVGSHLQMGIGDGIIPGILDTEIYSDIYIVKDDEAIFMAKELARKEGLLCGISSGTNVTAALALAKKLGKGKTVVTVLPDTGERYFSTPLF